MTESEHGNHARRGELRGDPERRNRIIEACLDVIADRGVADTSHRVVAAAAGVPLGSMTYYFDGMDDLLHQTFERFADDSVCRMRERFAGISSREEACEAVVRTIVDDVFRNQHDLSLNLEFYTLAARDPAYRDITTRWMGRSREQLRRFFDPRTAQMLDAMIEGFSIHCALSTAPLSEDDIREGVCRIASVSQPFTNEN
ncbi:TetR/AcrR family transcriptional regulator [Bifidobacterium callimiconis]|uniref:TetR family transcriptional regulator n=1 Tax=Bifidobacterium callimiconis TaxID=2306973 RepID=A0A430FFH8_9BIFI|nr:TetR family transcriptional regulator C-terminal domain-containing protein [Bifidobacterium callimiconis]RSX51570.1 TetR family transcriptional regulator [Bifidobacterium callimiconis]